MTGSEASQEFTALISNLDNERLQIIATDATIQAGKIAPWVFRHVMAVLAGRLDRRSFVNVCEAIRRDVDDQAEFAMRRAVACAT